VGAEIARRQLIFDQPVRGGSIGHPQQRFREHHQRETFLGGERILAQEVLHPADAASVSPDRRHQLAGAGVDPRLRRLVERSGPKKRRSDVLVRRSIGRAKRRHFGVGRGKEVV
jgi:hypothetical protein